MNEYEENCERLIELFELLAQTRKLVESLQGHCDDSGPTWHNESDVQLYLNVFSYIDAMENLQKHRQNWDKLVGSLKRVTRDIPESLQEKINHSIDQRDRSEYRHTYKKLVSFREQWEQENTAATIFRRLSDLAPQLAQEIVTKPGAAEWGMLSDQWELAWAWGAARTWLNEMVAPEAAQRAADRVAREQEVIMGLLAKLASARAWAWCLGRLTEPQRQSLHAWSLEVKHIGKGTGKYANVHRKAAREHLGQCQPAIPAWIMPLYRVAESIRPGHSRFDVAIIDEASQSGPEALSLLYLAEKIVVVGDDKQISPDAVGTHVEAVNRFRRELISDIPTNNALDPQNSFFDLAKIRYPARIRLTEHFRCMPEIIQFSNDLCYKTEPLIPLRQFGVGRLEPVIQTVHVGQGYTKGERQKTNPPEAIAIAKKIAELCKDKRYDGKSFGVISLLGDRQARQIEMDLLSLVDAKELSERRLICGDAYDFQGDERDVMFLSLVIAPMLEKGISALGDPKGRDQRRYNVAMSRAKDQVWLFHSASLNDLSPNDLRFRLLGYCRNPQRKQEFVGGIDLQELTIKMRSATRSIDKPPSVFDSWFEVDVFQKIATRGYFVVPQYEVSGYFIDLAIVGQKGKLAVECDGERWHGAEQLEKDAARQRDLERCQWPFFRIREGAFYLDQEAALEPLWKELQRQGIQPRGEQSEPDKKTWAVQEKKKELDATLFDIADVTADSIDDEEGIKKQDPSLPAYIEWEPHPIPNPRIAPRENVIHALVEIVQVEGPATWRRIFDRYRIGLELGRLKGPTREALEASAKIAVRTSQIVEWAQVDSDDWYNRLVRVPTAAEVWLRQRGHRKLEDMPPAEIAELMYTRNFHEADEELAFRQILEMYGLRRLTAGTREHLRCSFELFRTRSKKE